MIGAITNKIESVISLIRDPNYREFVRLLIRFGDSPRNKTYEIRFLNYLITVPDGLSFIFQFKEIFVNESYKFQSFTNSPVIYDCGANIGISCLYFKRIFPDSRIEAFEADPQIAKILQNNLDKNFIKNVNVIPKAVWKDNDGVDFGTGMADAGSIFSGVNKTKVESVRLRDLIAKENKIDFLKIDIEGAEIEVLKDCSRVLSNVKFLFVEYHGWKNFSMKLSELLLVLENNGFRYFIDSISELKIPFSEKNKIGNADLQLNIFAENIANEDK
jgi:FkbM family methyltransferase